MALIDLQSQYGPTNTSNDKGTGTILGTNISPISNAQFGNPTIGSKTVTVFDNLEAASHSSKYGAFNKFNKRGTGLTVDLFGNDPSTPEIDFTNYRP